MAKILFMDDEQELLNAFSELLELYDHFVLTCPNGKVAIQLYKNELEKNAPFDIVILDLVVPNGMGGVEALKTLLQINPEVKAIASSGYSNDPIMAHCHDYGFTAGISKPYTIESLNKMIQTVLSS